MSKVFSPLFILNPFKKFLKEIRGDKNNPQKQNLKKLFAFFFCEIIFTDPYGSGSKTHCFMLCLHVSMFSFLLSYKPWWDGVDIPKDRLSFSPEEQEQLLALPRRKVFIRLNYS